MHSHPLVLHERRRGNVCKPGRRSVLSEMLPLGIHVTEDERPIIVPLFAHPTFFLVLELGLAVLNTCPLCVSSSWARMSAGMSTAMIHKLLQPVSKLSTAEA